MGYYKVLGEPMCKAGYKGLYRTEPCPGDGATEEFMGLWYRYADTVEGVGHELSLSELFRLAELCGQEVVWYGREAACPHPAVAYGVDVTGVGGYSMLGEDFFCKAEDDLRQAVNGEFRPLCNEYGLFRTEADGLRFVERLNELKQAEPDAVEDEDWRVVHVFGLLKPSMRKRR